MHALLRPVFQVEELHPSVTYLRVERPLRAGVTALLLCAAWVGLLAIAALLAQNELPLTTAFPLMLAAIGLWAGALITLTVTVSVQSQAHNHIARAAIPRALSQGAMLACLVENPGARTAAQIGTMMRLQGVLLLGAGGVEAALGSSQDPVILAVTGAAFLALSSVLPLMIMPLEGEQVMGGIILARSGPAMGIMIACLFWLLFTHDPSQSFAVLPGAPWSGDVMRAMQHHPGIAALGLGSLAAIALMGCGGSVVAKAKGPQVGRAMSPNVGQALFWSSPHRAGAVANLTAVNLAALALSLTVLAMIPSSPTSDGSRLLMGMAVGGFVFLHVLSAARARQRLSLRRAKRGGERPAPDSLTDLSSRLCGADGKRSEVCLVEGDNVDAFVRWSSIISEPTVCVTTRSVEVLPPDELSFLLAHEAGHIRRGKDAAFLRLPSAVFLLGGGLMTLALDPVIEELAADEYACVSCGPEPGLRLLSRLGEGSVAVRDHPARASLLLAKSLLARAMPGYEHPSSTFRAQFLELHAQGLPFSSIESALR